MNAVERVLKKQREKENFSHLSLMELERIDISTESILKKAVNFFSVKEEAK